MTANSLQSLFKAIASASNEQELRQNVMAKAGKYFAARRWSLFFVDELPAPETLQEIYKLAFSTEHNPVLRYLVEHHAAVHDELVLPPGMWKTICPRADHAHVMAGPIVADGRLIGAAGFTRDRNDFAFDLQNLADLSALSLHLSTWLVRMRSPSSKTSKINRLTPREIEIAELVPEGLTNAKIGAALWITENSVKQALKRMFRKLEVSSRAEMVAQLSTQKIEI
ncbi:MAG: LuxR family transcriptional regulator [Hydrococcus sp. RM1_1_31]|nr:LuxR family transcriptional regulator [Hydrococcus sp. RM1_1_31]